MMRKLIFTILWCVGLHAASFAQGFRVPDYEFKSVSDYAKYEQVVLEACNWALSNPAQEQMKTQAEVGIFVIKWCSGTPTVLVDIYFDPSFQQIIMGDPDYLRVYIEGCVKHLLDAKKEAGTLNSSEAVGKAPEEMAETTYMGLKAMMDYYQRNKEVLGKNKLIDRYIKQDQKGRLRRSVEWHCAKAAGTEAIMQR